MWVGLGWAHHCSSWVWAGLKNLRPGGAYCEACVGGLGGDAIKEDREVPQKS